MFIIYTYIHIYIYIKWENHAPDPETLGFPCEKHCRSIRIHHLPEPGPASLPHALVAADGRKSFPEIWWAGHHLETWRCDKGWSRLSKVDQGWWFVSDVALTWFKQDHTGINLNLCKSVYLYVCLCIYLSVYLYIYLSIYIYIYIYIYISVYLSIYLTIYLICF